MFIRYKKILIIIIITLFSLQFLQLFSGGDLLFGFFSDNHYFNILNRETGDFGKIFETKYIYISIPNPFETLSYRIGVGEFTAWGNPEELDKRKICVLGYHFYPEENVDTIRQCIGVSIIEKLGYIRD